VIANDQELNATLERIAWFQAQVVQMRKAMANPRSYRLAAGGFLAEIDRMQLEVRESLSFHPSELTSADGQGKPSGAGAV
jgi:hypothetical protein